MVLELLIGFALVLGIIGTALWLSSRSPLSVNDDRTLALPSICLACGNIAPGGRALCEECKGKARSPLRADKIEA